MRVTGSGRACYLDVDETTVNLRAYFYVDASSGSMQLMRFRAGSTTLAALLRTSSGALQLAYRSGSSLVYVNSATVLPLDSWHCVELRVVVGGSGEYSVWLDGAEIGAFSIAGVDNNNYGAVSRLDVGCIYSSSSNVNIYVDNVTSRQSDTVPPSPDDGVVLFEDGFESGSFSAWSGVTGSPAVQTAIKYDGVYAMRVTGSGRACYLDVDETAVNLRAYFYVDASSGSIQLMRFRAGSTTLAALLRTSSGALQLAYRSGSSLVYVNSATVLPLDSWHYVELRVVVGGSGEYSVWLDGAEIGAFSIAGVDNNNYGAVSRLDVGCIYSSSSNVNIYVDNVALVAY